MKKCPDCGEFHVISKIHREGFPTDSKEYQSAHKQADIAEKKKYPSGYEKMKKIDDKLPNGELSGKNTKEGKIEVSSRVPKSLRKEVAYHEKIENRHLRHKEYR
jgi:hypothetical protein